MGGMLMVVVSSFARGCLPCVVPYRATGLSSRRHSWSRLQRLPGKGLCRTRCDNGPPWSCSCRNNRWCPTARRHNGSSRIRVRCAAAATLGPWGPFPWTTGRDGAPRRLLPPLDQALVKAVACELVAETQQPLSRQSLADVTARVHTVLGTPISRSTVWRILDTDAIKPWRYKYWIFPRHPHFADKAGPILDPHSGRL